MTKPAHQRQSNRRAERRRRAQERAQERAGWTDAERALHSAQCLREYNARRR